ncbi:MAG: ATP-binding cassette domain-containing protein [Verrucomicrobia bacterium]|nr:ATP-binding cassette domain-containing protein [Verrucomicrobiota bacterium]MBV8640102.1 ATP-binding cassette domain-containing protein [Verrucomicrobiota bacterium]
MALQITGLRKEFGGVVALAGVDVSIELDRIVGIIGPNGSGKTTLFNVVAGVHRPTSGRVLWQGKDITGKPTYQIARLGIVRTFQQAMSYRGLSVRENVRIASEHGRSYGGAAGPEWDSPDEILAFVGLAGLGNEMAGSMPFGNLRRLGVAVALAANPLLLLLDEPAAGLSENEISELMELILRFPRMGIGVCLIDHDMFLMSTLCERLVVLNFGTKIAEGPPNLVLNDPKVTEVYLGNEI